MFVAKRSVVAGLCLVVLAVTGCDDGDDDRPSAMLDDGGTAVDDAGSRNGDDAGTPGDPGSPSGECSHPIEQEQLRITNEERTRAGLAPLVCDPGLTRAARLHSQDMCDQGYFEHDSLDGRTFRDRIDAQGVEWRRIGENIARGQETPQEVHEDWMGSPGHRANIMSSGFGRIGIGYVECGRSGPYWTQDFAD